MGMIPESLSSSDRESLFQDLLEQIVKQRVQPEDKYEIAAILESIGWNDSRVAKSFGSEDVFGLAESFWDAIQNKVAASTYVPEKKLTVFSASIEVIRNFLRGLIFALPMAISVLSMLTLRFSLWSYENLSTELATSIAIGIILSFVVIGGFTQAIARRGFFYLSQGFYNMGRRITFTFVRIGFIFCALISAIILLVNLFVEVFPVHMVLIIVFYFFSLSAIWLSVTVMYILRKELVFTGLITFGIFIVWLLVRLYGIYNIILYQIIALNVVAIIGVLMVFYFFKAAERKMEKGISPSLPRMSITLYSILPYFTYGFLYFAFLYVDRVIGWSTNDSGFMPYIIWFRGPYELGLDFAILMLMIPMGVIEVVLGSFMLRIINEQENYLGSKTHVMNENFLHSYRKSLGIVSVISVFCAILIYFLVKFLDINYQSFLKLNLLGNRDTHFVFICGLIAYAILSVALMNAIILFSLSQPEIVNKAVSKAIIVNIVVGFLLSRWMSWFIGNYRAVNTGISGYCFSVIGLVIGSIVFVYFTSKSVVKVIKNLDYYIYSGS